MENFFLEITVEGQISDIKWSIPTHLVTSVNGYITDIFIPEDSIKIKDSLKFSETDKDGFFSLEEITEKNSGKNFNMCFLKDENRFFLFAIESMKFPDSRVKEMLKEIFHNFMLSIREYTRENPFTNQSNTRFQFEKIQSLNNQLINTKRMLEKANTKLNLLNNDLNNRLVKDALTGLLSRYQYRAEMEHLISLAPDDKGIFVFMDMDGFKKVNDTYGHKTGDDFLCEFAKRLDSLPLENKLTMRIAGDEFGLYVHSIPKDYIAFQKEIWSCIKEKILDIPFEKENIKLNFRLSAGMAVYNLDTDHIYDLIDYADFAMYMAKKEGKNTFCSFDKKLYVKEKGGVI